MNSGSDAGESFAILIIGYGADTIPNNAFIDSCEVLQCGANVSGLTIVNYGALAATPVYAQGAKIINNRVDGAVNGGGPPGGFDGGLFSHNTITNASHGIYHDTFPSENIVISENVITAPIGNGILFNTGSIVLSNFKIINNIVMSDSGIGFEGTVQNSSISGNRIIASGGAHYGVFLYGSSVNGIDIIGNIIDASLPFYNTAINVTTCLNRTPAGNPVPSMPDSCATVDPPIVIPCTPCLLP
jgi:hypothetical protein